MKQHFISITVLFLIFMTIGTSFGQSTSSQIQKAEDLLSTYRRSQGPGVSVAVSRNGKIIYKNLHGYANLEHKVQITDSTKFLVGSISKQFTAFAILLLEDQGKLSLDDDIRLHLPELSELPQKITIRQLANHTSGFRNNTDLNSLRGRTDDDLIGQEEMVALLLRQKKLNFEPGSRFQYINADYVLLAEIVSRTAQMSFATYIQKEVFTPLGMENSLFLDDPRTVVKNRALSYSYRDNTYRYMPMNRSIVGSTGLYTTAEDLSIWAMNYNRPKVGNPQIVQKMIAKSYLSNGESIPYGLGQETKIYKGLDVVFHGGGDAGYRAYLVRIPKHNLAVTVFGNFESFNPLNLSYGLIDIFLSEHITARPPLETPSYTHQELQQFEGDYQIFPGLYITISAEKDTLYFESYGSGEKLKLPVLAENEFEFPYIPHSKFVFKKNKITWHLSDFYYPGKKVTLAPPQYSELDTKAYLGTFYNDEIETSYTFIEKEGKIIITHPFNPDTQLIPIGKNIFITDIAYMGRIEFIRNKKGMVTACTISGQKAYDILFQKQ